MYARGSVVGRFVCGKCGYDAVYPSRVRWFDLPLVFLLKPYRCNKCYRRSYRLRWRGS
jgi:hypothetical protein